MTNVLTLVWIGILGACLGSFINVVALRDNDRKSIVAGRSKCPHCGHELAWYDLVPVLSYLSLLGKCRYCRKSIAIRYPLVELATTGVAVLLATKYLTHPYQMVGLMAVSLLFIAISLIDLQTLEVSTEYTVVAGILGMITGAAFGGVSLISLVGGAVAGAGSIAFILYGWKLLFKQDGMGVGDIWIAGAVGATVGFPLIFIALGTAVLSGAVIGSAYASLSKKGLQTAIPFGPFLFFGLLFTLMWGQAVWRWYILYI